MFLGSFSQLRSPTIRRLGGGGRGHLLTQFVLWPRADPHFLRVPCWKITLFVLVPVLGPLLALVICYNWLHRRLAGVGAGGRALGGVGPLQSGGGGVLCGVWGGAGGCVGRGWSSSTSHGFFFFPGQFLEELSKFFSPFIL